MRRSTLQLVQASTFWYLVLCVVHGLAGGARAQGPTSATIAGHIRDVDGRGLPGVEVVVTNQATGISMHGVSRAEGRFLGVGSMSAGRIR